MYESGIQQDDHPSITVRTICPSLVGVGGIRGDLDGIGFCCQCVLDHATSLQHLKNVSQQNFSNFAISSTCSSFRSFLSSLRWLCTNQNAQNIKCISYVMNHCISHDMLITNDMYTVYKFILPSYQDIRMRAKTNCYFCMSSRPISL